MKILFYKGGEGEGVPFAPPRECIDDSLSDASTLEFKDTDIANIDRDDEKNFTVYTKDGHFYVTLTIDDVKQLANKLTPHEIFNIDTLRKWIVTHTRAVGGIDLVMVQLKAWVIDILTDKKEDWL